MDNVPGDAERQEPAPRRKGRCLVHRTGRLVARAAVTGMRLPAPSGAFGAARCTAAGFEALAAVPRKADAPGATVLPP